MQKPLPLQQMVFVGNSQNPLQFGTLIQATQGLPRSNISKLKACATLENKLTFVGEDLNNEELIAKLTKHLMEISSSFQFINSDKIQIQFENNQLTSKEILSAGHRVLIQLK
jgi:aspartokinase